MGGRVLFGAPPESSSSTGEAALLPSFGSCIDPASGEDHWMFSPSLSSADGLPNSSFEDPSSQSADTRGASFRRLISIILRFTAASCIGSAIICPSFAGLQEDSSLPPPRIVKSDETLLMDSMKHDARALFEKGDFTQLDEVAARWRKEKKVFASGTSAIMVYYRIFSMPPPETSDEDWEQTIRTLQDWSREKPASITSRVALAEAWVSFGWKARGNGYASSVTPEGNNLLMQRLHQADLAIQKAGSMRQSGPDYYLAAQSVAMGEGWGHEVVDKLCNDGLKLYPEACSIYLQKCYYLMTKWYGKPGEWEAYATASADKLAGEEGDLLYARILGYLDGKSNNILEGAKISWPRAKKGYEIIMRRYPDSLNMMSSYARVACKAQDWQVARRLFDKIGDRVTLVIWKNEADFVACRNDAYKAR